MEERGAATLCSLSLFFSCELTTSNSMLSLLLLLLGALLTTKTAYDETRSDDESKVGTVVCNNNDRQPIQFVGNRPLFVGTLYYSSGGID